MQEPSMDKQTGSGPTLESWCSSPDKPINYSSAKFWKVIIISIIHTILWNKQFKPRDFQVVGPTPFIGNISDILLISYYITIHNDSKISYEVSMKILSQWRVTTMWGTILKGHRVRKPEKQTLLYSLTADVIPKFGVNIFQKYDEGCCLPQSVK